MTETVQLKHQLSLRNLFTFAFGSIIGVGWIIVAGEWINGAGPAGASLAFLGGALMICFVAVSYAEIASMYPVSGGEVAYVYKLYGYRAAFAIAWFMVLSYSAAGPFEFVAVGWLVTTLIPAIEGSKLYSIAGYDLHTGALVVGSVVAVFIAGANLLGAKMASHLQDILSVLLIIVSIVFVVFAFLNGDSSNLEPMFEVGSSGLLMPGVLAILVTAPFWFAGFDVVSQAMGESEDKMPMSRLGNVLALAIFSAALFYCLVIFATAVAVPRASLATMDFPVAGALESAFNSKVGSKLVMIAGLLGLMTSWNAMFFAATRIIFAMSHASMLPKWAGYVHPTHSTPSHAILLVFLACFFGLLGRGAISPIIEMGSLILTVAFFLVCLGVVILRILEPSTKRPYRAPSIAIPMLAVISMIWLFLLVVSSDLKSAFDGAIPPQWFAIIGWAVLGIVFWKLTLSLRQNLSKSEMDERILKQSSARLSSD